MVLSEAGALPLEVGVRNLDPFSFLPHLASRIGGLGGTDRSNPAYAFHTPYVTCVSGVATFVIRPIALEATVGNLVIRINAISTVPNSIARSVKMTSIPLETLSHQGEVRVTVNAKSNLLYAAVAFIYGATDAVAQGLEILLDQPEDGVNLEERPLEPSYTSFGQSAASHTTRLVSDEPGHLHHPISQPCATSQLEEPAYALWASALKFPAAPTLQNWRSIYVAAALDEYGMMHPGARGLGFEAAGSLSALMEAKGCEVVTLDEGQAPAAAEQEYDFCWSTNAIEKMVNARDALDFLLEAQGALKIGGLSVHVFPYLPSPELAQTDGVLRLARNDIERIALEMVSLGHQISQLSYGVEMIDRGRTGLILRQSELAYDTTLGAVPYGLIIRKGESNFF